MRISEAESVVMQVLWTSSPLAVDEVARALVASQGWAEPTVKTLLSRLLRKGAVRAEKDGRRFLYAPVLQREAWLAQESESLLDRLFNGRVAPLVAHFSERRTLSRADIDALRRLINELDDGR